ncbi:hypothetical protein, partial [uncultured Rikenella sp.]|uniref:hypothetical protein n=2 Tax=uncultured Rikenella sp. TaxID=368003 RepID=UPI00261D78B7
RFNYFGGEPNIDESRKAREQRTTCEKIRSARENPVARPLKRAYSAGWLSANPARIATGDV